MRIYTYRCTTCRETHDELVRVAERNEPRLSPCGCASVAERVITPIRLDNATCNVDKWAKIATARHRGHMKDSNNTDAELAKLEASREARSPHRKTIGGQRPQPSAFNVV